MTLPPLAAERLWRVLYELAPMASLASAAGLRAMPAEGRDGKTGGGDPQAQADRLHATGELERARVAWRQLAHVDRAHLPVLEWLIERAVCWDCPSVPMAARMYALHAGPVDMREALPKVEGARKAAQGAYDAAGKQSRSKSRGALTVDVSDASGALAVAQAAEARVTLALVTWGWSRLAAAVTAWEDAGKKIGVAA